MAGKSLRIVTLNFWGLESPLDRRIALAARQLRALDPDVVCLQEVQPLELGGERTTAHVLGEALGLTAQYAEACGWDEGTWGEGTLAGSQGLAMLTREPLLDARVHELPEPRPGDVRILFSGQVATAGGPIWIHTTHLHYRLDDGAAREEQVMSIDFQIRQCGRDQASAPQILCGDLNATPDSDEIRYLRGLTTLGGKRTHFQDAWLRLHREPGPGDGPEQGITWSSDNELTRPLRSLDIDRRIDYVFVTSRKKDGRATISECKVVLTEREAGICASDHYGVMADVQVIAG